MGVRCSAAWILKKIYSLQQFFGGLVLHCTTDGQLLLCKAFLAKEGRIYLIQLRGHHRNCPSSGCLHCRRCQGCNVTGCSVRAHVPQAWGDAPREVSTAIVVCPGDAHAVSHRSCAGWPSMQNLLTAAGVQAPQKRWHLPASCKGALITGGFFFTHRVLQMADFMALLCASVMAAPGHHLWFPPSSL